MEWILYLLIALVLIAFYVLCGRFVVQAAIYFIKGCFADNQGRFEIMQEMRRVTAERHRKIFKPDPIDEIKEKNAEKRKAILRELEQGKALSDINKDSQ